MALRSLSSLLVIGLITSACGGLETLRGKRKGKDDTNRVAQGELTQLIANLQAQKHQSACDTKAAPRMRELAAVLDAKKAELEAVASAQPESKLYHRVSLGPIPVRELNEPFVPKAGWLQDDYGWDGAFAYYDKIAATPVDAKWLALNEYVRSIVVDDSSRLIYERTMGLKRADLPALASAQKAVDACVADSACTTPTYDAAAAALIDRIPTYKTRSRADRDYLASLKEWLDFDVRTYAFEQNPSLTLAANGDIAIELDAGEFAAVTPQLETYITSVWKNDAHALKINWVSQADHPNAFKFIVETGLGGRSYLQYSSKTIHLFADVRAPSIAHEVGHALGFSDHYYTSFDEATCRYTAEYSEEDVMSTSEGKVTADDWKELESHLPAPPAA